MAAWSGGQKDQAIHLWDAATGKELHHWKTNWPTSLSLSPDSKTLASGADLQVRLWDVATGKELRTLGPHHGGVIAVVFSPDGRMLAAAALDHTITLWELATGRERLVIKTGGSVTAFAFSPDSRWIASVNNGSSRHIDASGQHRDVGNENKDQVYIWDVATGRETHRLAGHRGGINAVAFSQNGKLLVSASMDTTALIWDAAGLLPARSSGLQSLNAGALESLWSALGSADASHAHRAVWSMIGVPRASVLFLKERLRPIGTADPHQVSQLLADLDSDRFAVREKATKELEKMGEAVRPALRKTLASQPTLEVRRRVEQLLEKLDGPEPLRRSRAVEVLEHIGTTEAVVLLQTLARGVPEARLTQEAKASLERLAKQHAVER